MGAEEGGCDVILKLNIEGVLIEEQTYPFISYFSAFAMDFPVPLILCNCTRKGMTIHTLGRWGNERREEDEGGREFTTIPWPAHTPVAVPPP